MHLSDLNTGQSAVIIKVSGHGGFRRRILEMGFVRGKKVTVVLNAPLKDPIKYKVMDYEVSLRRSEAAMIEVLTEEEAQLQINNCRMSEDPSGCGPQDILSNKFKEINIALVGNPNSGKTSLFNSLSGGHEHVGNYGGVTVDAKSGHFKYGGYKFNITDLPGTYALSAYTPEELYVRRHLLEKMPDIILNTVVASNLERNLYLTTELIDINPRMVVALNMYDELTDSGAVLDYRHLEKMLGIPMVPVVARSGKGTDRLLDTIIDVYENRSPVARHIHINYSPTLENEITALSRQMKEDGADLPKHFPPRYWAMKFLEGDKEIEQLVRRSEPEHYPQWEQNRDAAVTKIKKQLAEDVETAMTNEKYGFISGALKETFTPSEKEQNKNTAIIDAIVTHKLFSFPIFLFLMWIMFNATFTLGAYPQEWIETFIGYIGSLVEKIMGEGALKDLLVNGIIGGVGSVIVFLPNILILYLFISLMEDSGYMARAAFIMDKIMHKIGLHGKSFIPLIMGFGCNVPAIISSRTIESRSSRIITILINPFMSCSARLPVYILMAGTFFPRNSGLALMLLYLLGIVVAIFTAKLMRRFLFKTDDTPFVMELPPYRVPTLNATLRHMWDKGAQYLRKIGSVILLASIVIWFLSYYPHTPAPSFSDQIHATADQTEITAAGLPGGRQASEKQTSEEKKEEMPLPAEQLSGGSRPTGEHQPTGEAPSAKSNPSIAANQLAGSGQPAGENNLGEKVQSAGELSFAGRRQNLTGQFVNHPSVTNEQIINNPQSGRQSTYLERIGKFCEPVMKPLGLNWKAGVALLSGAAAKEIIVSTLGVLAFSQDNPNGPEHYGESSAATNKNDPQETATQIPESRTSSEKIAAAGRQNENRTAYAERQTGADQEKAARVSRGSEPGFIPVAPQEITYKNTGKDLPDTVDLPEKLSENGALSARLLRSGDFTGCSAISFMVFVLLYFPCIATVAAISNETGSWKWAAASVIYSTTIAWVAAFIIYNICKLF